jgi:hypothetical protein
VFWNRDICFPVEIEMRSAKMKNLLFALLALAATPAIAQDNLKLSATDISVRTNLTFKVSDTSAQKMLPSGWELNPPMAGPAKGFNLGVTLIDYLMAQDPEGKPMPARSTVVLSIPAKKIGTGEAVTMVFGGFIAEAGVPGPYSVFGPANITVDRRAHTEPDGKSIINEAWQAKTDDGSVLDIQIEFTRGSPARGRVEAKIHSAAKPNFYRIYRFEQTADVARSTAIGIDHVANFSFKATGPSLGPIFDGTEKLISITSIPNYLRSVYLPAM